MSLNLMLESGEAYARLPRNEEQMRKLFNNLASFFNDRGIPPKQEAYEEYLLKMINLLLSMAHGGMGQQLIFDCSLNVIKAYRYLQDICRPKPINSPVLDFMENYIAPGLDPRLQGKLLLELTRIS